MPESGLVLFAHGSRDARWAEPFELLAAKLRQDAPELAIGLAFLELMPPDLETAVADLASRGCVRISVVPAFLGQGAHVRRDLPALIATIGARHPALKLTVAPSLGEDPGVLAAIAAYCVRVA